LNRVKQRLQFLRPPPKTDSSSAQEQHQSSSSSSSSSSSTLSDINIPIIDLTLPEFPFEFLRNPLLEVDKSVSDDN